MATITEDYVSFEVAKLLKEKGFDEPCQFLYFSKYKQEGDFLGNFNTRKNSEINELSYSAPTLQMAMKWLREVHDKNIIFNMIPDGNDCYVLWTFNILSNKNYKIIWGTKQPKYKTYEEACEAAIKYCLENLI